MSRGLSLVGSGWRFVRHEPREAWLLARAGAWVAFVSVLVKFWPLPRVLAVVSPSAGGRMRRAACVSDERVAQLLDSLLALDVLCFTPTCWKRAPVLHRYLALGGRETRIVFGLRKGGGDALAGHAWLEEGGRPIFEADAPDYTVTYVFPPTDAEARALKPTA